MRQGKQEVQPYKETKLENLDGFIFLPGSVFLAWLQWSDVNMGTGDSNVVMQIVCVRILLPLGDTAPGVAPGDHSGRLSCL